MFDKILGSLFDKADAGGDGHPDATLFDKLRGSLFGDGRLGAGLKGMMDKFTGSGLGETFKSWVGTGENLPISADQIGKVFDPARLTEMAQKVGIPVDALKEKLAAHLPGVVDRMTPTGHGPRSRKADPARPSRRAGGVPELHHLPGQTLEH